MEFYRYLPNLLAFEEDGGTMAAADAAESEAPQEAVTTEEEPSKGEREEKKYSEEDLDRIINQKFAKWQRRADTEIAEKVAEAEKLANMSAQEKALHEKNKLEKLVDELQGKLNRAEMLTVARDLLAKEGVKGLGDGLLGVLVTGEAESTDRNVREFVELFNKAVNDEVKERLRGGTPKKGTGVTKSLTKEDILKTSDTHERLRLIGENLELFKQ